MCPRQSGATSSRTSTTRSSSSSGRQPGKPPCRWSARPFASTTARAMPESSPSSMLILAFDTATEIATSALVADGEVLGERISHAVTLLEDVDALLRRGGAHADEIDALAVGVGPGSFTGVRVGLATARGLALALDLPVAGVSTLEALAAGAPGALPVIDARRREIFVLQGDAARVLAPAELRLVPGTVCVGNGAVRYRSELEAAG